MKSNRFIKRLDWYIIKKFLGTYVFAIALIISIAVVFDFNEKMDKLMEHEAPWSKIIFEYYMNFIPYFSNLFSPLFVFIAVIFFTSKLAENSEIIAMFSTGMSFKRMMRPYMISAAIIALTTFMLSSYVIPKGSVTRLNFEDRYIKPKKQNTARNVQLEVDSGVIAYIDNYNNAMKTGNRFSLDKFVDKKLVSHLTARRVTYDTTTVHKWTIHDYMIRELDGLKEKITKGDRIDSIINMEPSDFLIMKNQQELIDEYLYYCLKQRKLDEKTVRAYRIDLRQFSEFCVQKKLVTEKAVIRQYILHLHESYKQKTVKRKVASIKAFYSYLEDEEIIDDSPLRKIRTEFREEKILPRSIPYSVLQSLLSSMYSKKSIESTIYERKLLNRDIAVVETLFSTGIRISELCNLLQKNIDIEQGIFCIKGKGGKERYLQIGTEEVLVQLKEYKRHWEKELDASEFFFLNRYGERYSEQSARRMIQRYTQEAMIEIHITPHMFRHAFATLLLEEEVDIRFIQKMLGHASIMTTQIYAEVALKKQMEILKMKHPRNRMEILEKHIETEGKGVV